MNLEAKLNDSLNEVLKSSGYIFEIINNNKKQSNFITGSNNQLISPTITLQLSNSITRFDDILDETLSKFNDAKWCIEQILENKQKQEELKLKEEIERQKRKEEDERRRKQEEERRVREEEERKRREEEERVRKQKEEAERAAAAAARAKLEEEARVKREQEEKERQERERQERERQERERKESEERRRQEQEDEERARRNLEQEEALRAQQQQQTQQTQTNDNINDFMTDGFDFNMNDMGMGGDKNAAGVDIPNPSDILSSINYPENMNVKGPDASNDAPGGNDGENGNNNNNNTNENSNNANNADLDLDMNNLLGNDESILGGLDMSLLDQGYANDNPAGVSNDMSAMEEEEFDVDNFLNQFGGGD